jgi:hypothetical protein
VLCLPNKPGVKVLIIACGDFHQFSAKKRVFLKKKTNVLIQYLHQPSICNLGKKAAIFFSKFLFENIFKKHRKAHTYPP